jgi:hypothetical protein
LHQPSCLHQHFLSCMLSNLLEDTSSQSLLPKHPTVMLTSSSALTSSHLPLSNLETSDRAQYGPARMNLVVLGGQTLEQLESWARQAFEPVPKGLAGPTPAFSNAGMPFEVGVQGVVHMLCGRAAHMARILFGAASCSRCRVVCCSAALACHMRWGVCTSACSHCKAACRVAL